MALVLNDRVKETSTTTGTGTLDLGGAATGFQTFVAGIGNSNTCYYCISAQGGSQWEVGIGTVTDASPDTLSRDTIYANSAGNTSALTLSAGTKDVFVTQPASKAVYEDNSGNISVPGTVDGVDIATRDGVLTSTTTTANAALPKAGGTMTGNLVLSGANITMSGSETVDGVDVSAAGALATGALPKAGGEMTGNITMASTETVDGRDLSVDGGKLDGIEVNADVTDATNVNAAGALMNSDLATKGTIAVGDGSGDPTILSVGTNGQVLKADSSAGAGVAWAASSIAADDISAGDAAVTLTTTSGNITIDAQADDSDIIFKGTDGGVDTTFLTLDGSDAGKATFSGDITAGDNIGLKLGASLDLQLYHNTNSFIENYTGNLTIDAAADDSDIIFKGTDGGVDTTYLTLDGSDAGTAIFNHDIKLGDNNLIKFGASDDLYIYHDTSHSRIVDQGTGNLKLQGDDLNLTNSDDSKTYIGCVNGAEVNLYHNNSLMFSTDANGCKMGDNKELRFGDGDDLKIFHEPTNNHSVIKEDGGGHLKLQGENILLMNAAATETYIECVHNADVQLYYDNTKMATTVAEGFRVEPDRRLEIANGATWSGELAGKIEHHSNSMYIQYSDSYNFITRNSSGSNTLTIDSSGNGTFMGNCTAYSDIRLKEDVKTIENALDKVSKLRGVEYTRKETKEKEIGVIAQEVKEIVPELVTIENLRSDINPDDLEDMHTMKYQNTVGLLIEAIKELKENQCKCKCKDK